MPCGLPGVIWQNLIKVTTELAEKDGQDEEGLLKNLHRLYHDAAQSLSDSGPEGFLEESSRYDLSHAGERDAFLISPL